MTVCAAFPAHAQEDQWRFGIGTGLKSFSLDGDVGFATSEGGLVTDIDVDNSDTMDMLESAFGAAAFASKGPWTINLMAGTRTLEDDDASLDIEWDNTTVEGSVVYNFANTGNHRWGVLVGARYIEHEWKFTNKATSEKLKPDDDWLDAIVGLTHSVPFSEKWSWSNRVDYGFGDSEGVWFGSTALNWRPWQHWVFNLNLSILSAEFNDEDDIDDPDFYYYDVDEPAIGLGFMYLW